jgi:hypothetical protein
MERQHCITATPCMDVSLVDPGAYKYLVSPDGELYAFLGCEELLALSLSVHGPLHEYSRVKIADTPDKIGETHYVLAGMRLSGHGTLYLDAANYLCHDTRVPSDGRPVTVRRVQ